MYPPGKLEKGNYFQIKKIATIDKIFAMLKNNLAFVKKQKKP